MAIKLCRLEDIPTDEFLLAWYGKEAVDRMNAYFESDEFKASSKKFWEAHAFPNSCATGTQCESP